MTNSQKQIVGYAIALLIMVISSIATAYGIVIPELKSALKPASSIGARATQFNGILCNSGETNCVESYGMNIDVKNATGTRTFGVTASSGAVTANQLTVGTLVSQTVGYDTQGTFAVTAPTAVASATPAALVNTLGANNDILSLQKAATPVFKVGNAGSLQHAGFTVVDAATSITVTNGASFTPTGSYQPITSAGTVTPTLATTGYTAGTVIYLVNKSNTTINFASTGNQQFTSACALAQYNSLAVLWDGTNWLKLECSND